MGSLLRWRLAVPVCAEASEASYSKKEWPMPLCLLLVKKEGSKLWIGHTSYKHWEPCIFIYLMPLLVQVGSDRKLPPEFESEWLPTNLDYQLWGGNS